MIGDPELWGRLRRWLCKDLISATVQYITYLGRVYTVTNMCSPFQSQLDKQNPFTFGTGLLLAPPIFMMLMCARGFILWIMNVGLVIYLGAAASKLYRKVR